VASNLGLGRLRARRYLTHISPISPRELPDLQAKLAAGQHRVDLPSLVLADPKAKAGSKSRGSIEGSYSLLEKSGGQARYGGDVWEI